MKPDQLKPDNTNFANLSPDSSIGETKIEKMDKCVSDYAYGELGQLRSMYNDGGLGIDYINGFFKNNNRLKNFDDFLNQNKEKYSFALNNAWKNSTLESQINELNYIAETFNEEGKEMKREKYKELIIRVDQIVNSMR